MLHCSLVAKQTLQQYRRQEDEEAENSGEGRLKNLEKLVLDVLIFAEDQERELGYLKEAVMGKKGKPAEPGPSISETQKL